MKADVLFDILSNKYRRRIIQLCLIRPRYQQEIAEILQIGPSLVMKHLKVLEKEDIIKSEDKSRPEGGRNIKFYSVSLNPKIDFNMSKEDLVEIEIEDVSDENIPVTQSRKKIISRDDLTEEDINLVKNRVNIILTNEIEKKKAFLRYKSLEKRQTREIRSLGRKIGSEKRVLIKIIRFLIERFGFERNFTHKDIIDGLGVDKSTAEEIITILSDDIGLISRTDTKIQSNLPEWKLNKVYQKDNMDFI